MRIGDGRIRALLSYVATDFQPIQEEQTAADVRTNMQLMCPKEEKYIFYYAIMLTGLELEQVEVCAFEADDRFLSGGRIAIDGCRAHEGEVRAQTSRDRRSG